MRNEAARLVVEQLRARMKDQALSGVQLADEIERITGARPSAVQVARWVGGANQLLRINPAFYAVTAALGLDPIEVLTDIAEAIQPVFVSADTASHREVGA